MTKRILSPRQQPAIQPHVGPRPITEAEIVRTFRSHADNAQEAFMARHAAFVKDVGRVVEINIIHMVGSNLEALAVAQHEAATWREVLTVLTDPNPEYGATFRDRLALVASEAQAFASSLLGRRPWEQNSTSGVANILERAALSGKARAWDTIRVYPPFYLDETHWTIAPQGDSENTNTA